MRTGPTTNGALVPVSLNEPKTVGRPGDRAEVREQPTQVSESLL